MLSLSSRFKLYEILEKDEGFRQYPYQCTAGKLTVGIGRNLEARGISHEEAVFLLQNDVRDCVNEMLKAFPWMTKLDDVRKIVLINMCFNLGIAGFSQFKKMLDAVEKSDFALAAKEMRDSLWFTQVKSRGERLALWMEQGHF